MKELLEAFISRKFIAFASASVFLYLGKLSAEYWFYVTLAYIGFNVADNILSKFVSNGKGGG